MNEKLTILLADDLKEFKDSKEEDISLVTETLNNPESFGKIMNKYSPRITRYIYRIAGSSSFEIDDLLQNIFIKVYKNLNNFDSALSFSAWIYRIAHNEAIDYIRKLKIRPRTIMNDEEEDFLFNIPDKNNDLIEDLNNNMIKDHILEIFSKIREKYRSVLILKYLEDKDYNEISDILKIPLGTVATLLHRAKKEFKIIAIDNNINKLDI